MKEGDNEYKSSVIISYNDESQSIMESNYENNEDDKDSKITIPLLTNIKLKIEYGDFIGIYGSTGSGKTCLLNAILINLLLYLQFL